MTESINARRSLTKGQGWVLGGTILPMIAIGCGGAVGTFTNIDRTFHSSATALGVVAAGEGVTLVLSLLLVGMTMMGQSSPLVVRVGLWVAPVAAAGVTASMANDPREAAIYAITPMAMCASAEGLGLLARRVVVYRSGVDVEAQARNAKTMRQLAYHRARAESHCCPALKMPMVAAFTVPMFGDEDAPPAGARRGGSSARCRCYRQGAGGVSRPPR
ncbi:hypothetical protein ACWGBU_32600 [Streptomyces vinaceus]